MAWEKVVWYKGCGERHFKDATVSFLSTGELYFNRVAVEKFALKPGRVTFLIDREMMRVGFKMDPHGNWMVFNGGCSSLRVGFKGIPKQLEIPLPERGERAYATLSEEDGMVVFSYKEWVSLRK